MSKQIPIGDILILRGGLENIALEKENPMSKRKQALRLVEILDELIERREKEAHNAAGS